MMHPQKIKNILNKKKITIVSIAKHLDVKPPAVHQVISNKTTSYKIQMYIAELIKLPANKIFEMKTDFNNKPVKPGRPMKFKPTKERLLLNKNANERRTARNKKGKL